jgi:di/tricarboxylate transporter
MASSPHDPQMAHSLWLQRRSTRRSVRRAQWRSDWTPVGLLVLLLGLLILLSVFLPSNEAVQRVKQADQSEQSGRQLPVVGVLSER